MEYLRTEVISFLETTTGREIEYDSVSPSVLRYLEINRMRILSEEESTNILEIEKFRVYYNIFKLIGKNPGTAFSRVSIEDSFLAIDLVKDKDLIDLMERLLDQFQSEGPREINLVLSGRNIGIDIQQEDTRVSLRNLFFDIDTRSETPEIELSGDVTGAFPQVHPNLTAVTASLTLSGGFTRSMTEATLKPAISELSVGNLTVESQTFQLSLADEIWRLTKIQDRLPLDLSATFDSRQNVIEAAFVTAGFVPQSVITYRGEEDPRGIRETVLGMPVTGEGGLRYSIEDNTLSYTGSFETTISRKIGPFSGITAKGEYAGDLETLSLSDFLVSTDQGVIEVNGSTSLSELTPEGEIRVTDLLWPLERRISGLFTIAGDGNRIAVSSNMVRIGGEELSSVEATVLPNGKSVAFNTGFTLGAGDENRVVAEGSATLGEKPEFEISDITVRSVPLQLISDLGGLDDTSSNIPVELLALRIDADAFLQVNDGRYLFSVPSFKAYSDDGLNMITARISGNNNAVSVSDFRLNRDGFSAGGEITVDIGDPDNLDIQAAVTMFDTTYTVGGVLHNRERFTFSGDYGVEGAITLRQPGFAFELQSKTLPIPYGEITYVAALNVDGSFTDGENWSIESDDSTFGPVTLPVLGEMRAGFSGSVTPERITGEQIRILDQYSELVGSGYLEYNISNGRDFAGEVSLENQADEESYSAGFAISGESIEADVSISGGLLQRIGTLPVDGRIYGDVRATGDVSFPDISASLVLEKGRFAGDAIAAGFDVTLDPESLSVQNLKFEYLTNRMQNGSGILDFSNGAFSLSGSYAGSFRDKIITSQVLFSGSFAQAFSREDIASVETADFSGVLRAGSIVFGEENPDDWVFDIARVNQTLTVDGGPESAMYVVVNEDSSFSIELRDPLPIVATARGLLSGGDIDAELSVSNLDMEGMESILVIPFFNIVSGQAYGTLLISGRLNDPDIYGDLFGRELLAHINVVPETIGPFDAQLSFKGKSLLINRTVLPAGDAQVVGTAEFTLDHWLPNTFDIQLATASAPGIHIRSNFGKVDTDGYGHGELFISGDPFAIKLSGELIVSNGSVIIGEMPPPQPGGPPLIADLTLVSGRKVVFLWPNRNVPILTAHADTGQRVRIQDNPLTNTLDIDGEIEVQSGEVFYFRRSFRIREGSVLLEEDENSVDPRISVRAESRDITDEGDELRIFLVIENQPFSQFQPRFESVPPMSQTEIYAALGQNLRDELGGDFYGISSALLITSDIFSQFGVVRNFEQRVRDLLNLDLFSIRTHILQNVLSEQLIPSETALAQNTPSASRYLDNTTLFLGKYFGNDIFLEAMVRLRTNQALLSNQDAGDDLYVDSEIRLEWKTPLFLLELSLLPDLMDPLSSIQRARLGLSWDIWY